MNRKDKSLNSQRNQFSEMFKYCYDQIFPLLLQPRWTLVYINNTTGNKVWETEIPENIENSNQTITCFVMTISTSPLH